MAIDLKSHIGRALLPTGRKEVAGKLLATIMAAAKTGLAQVCQSEQDLIGEEYIAGQCLYIASVLGKFEFQEQKPLEITEFQGFKDLVFTCWEYGLPVLPIHNIPKGFKKLNWAITKAPRQIIFLGPAYSNVYKLSINLVEALSHCVSKTQKESQKWTSSFLFPEGIIIPKPCAADKLIEWAKPYTFKSGLAIAYAASCWERKYESLAQIAINKISDPFDMSEFSATIFGEFITPKLGLVSLPVSFFLQESLAPRREPTKGEKELAIMQERINGCADCPEDIKNTAKTIAGMLNCLPLFIRFSDWHISFILPSKSRCELRVYANNLVEYEIGSKSGTITLEQDSDLQQPDILPFLKPAK